MKMMKTGTLYGIAAVVVVLGSGMVLHSRSQSNKANQALPKRVPLVAVAPVQIGSIARTIDTTGTVEPESAINIVPKVEQRIIWMPLKEGDIVKRGQVIVRLESSESTDQLSAANAEIAVSEARLRDILAGSRPQELRSARAALAQAEANLKQADRDLQHVKKLYGASGIPEQQLQEAQSRYETAQANAESAKATLEDAETDLSRLKRMLKIGGVSQEDVDKAQTRYHVAKSSLSSAQSTRKNAKNNLEHVEELNVKVIPQQQFDNADAKHTSARSAVEAARARLDLLTEGASATQIAVAREQVGQARLKAETLRTQADYCTIKSPSNGIITKLFVNEGDLAQTRQPIMSISENAKMIIKAALPDREAGKVSPGRPVMVKVGGPQDEQMKLKVTRVYPSTDPATHLVPFEVAIPSGLKMPQGSFARVSIVMQKKDDAVVVPVDAVVRKPGGKSMVFVVETGIAHARPIMIGLEAKGKAEVLSGVQPGEKLVVRGQEMLKDGAEVKAKEQKMGPGSGRPGMMKEAGAEQGKKARMGEGSL